MQLKIIFQVLTSCAFLIFSSNLVSAQIIPDNSTNSKVNSIDESKEQIAGGTTRGSNLFHSFQEFNIKNGQEVLFANPIGIENILTRVTGSNISLIDGKLGVEGAANLFLINPNGIIFGHNASLNINGSLIATTAEEVIFGDRGTFAATATEVSPLLTINPSALLFNQLNGVTIVNRSTAPAGVNALGESVFGLRVSDGKSLLLASSEITLDGGNLIALGGNIGLVGTQKAQLLELQTNGDRFKFILSDTAIAGKIEIKRESQINVSEFSNLGSGSIQIAANQLKITDGSLINADTFTDSQTKTAIEIRASELTISKGAQISSSIKEEGVGKGGNLSVFAANSVTLTGASNSNNQANNSNNNNSGGGNGNGNGNGNGGENNKPSKLASDARGTGQGGNLIINTPRLIVQDGARISASATENSQGGNVIIKAQESVTVAGAGVSNQRQRSSGISTQVQSNGRSGILQIETQNLVVAEGAEIIATTFGNRSGGDISLKAKESITVTGVSQDGKIQSQIVAETGRSRDFNDQGVLRGTGHGGNIELISEQLTVEQGAKISVDSLGKGDAGNLKITAANLNLLDRGSIRVSAIAQGEAGSLNIDATEIKLDNASLTAETKTGNQGNITLENANVLLLNNQSQITTNATEKATGGDITITADAIALENSSSITANAVEGKGGNIFITTQGLFLEQNTSITATSRNIGGTITVNSPNVVDPTSGIIELPNVPVDAEGILAQNLCQLKDDKIAGGSSFIITGRGGITPTSETSLDDLDNVVRWTNPHELQVSSHHDVKPALTDKKNQRDNYPYLQQSQGWVTTADGSIWLVANASQTTPQNSGGIVHPSCGS